ncbi:MAG: hypothetical protein KatS3mg121_1061 [Gammaproteobacteria bacterium]|nr:MAG: hypothetical protein KatS3mg121_1061 [Gammaproteobacteria bacterium]
MKAAQHLRRLAERFDALSGRERVILTVTLFVALWAAWDAVFWRPLQSRLRAAEAQHATLQAQITALEAQRNAFERALSEAPDAALQARLERRRRELAEVERALGEQTLAFVAPEEMLRVLGGMFEQRHGLVLRRLESLPPVDPLAPAEGGRPPAEPSGVWLHPVVLEFDGDYLGALEYVRRLERLPWKFRWHSLQIDALEDGAPRVRVRLRLETLSVAEEWLGV